MSVTDKNDTHDPVNRPRHYTAHPSGIECIDIAENFSFNLGNAIKYCWRWRDKNGLEDARKAVWYLRRESNIVACGWIDASVRPKMDRVLKHEQDHHAPLAELIFGLLSKNTLANIAVKIEAWIDSQSVSVIEVCPLCAHRSAR